MSHGYGFLMLTSHLGNPQRKPLTIAQMRNLTIRVRQSMQNGLSGTLDEKNLIGMGYDHEMATRIVRLMEDEELLAHYLRTAEKRKCIPLTRQDPAYPLIVRKRLGLDSPGCLWVKGNPEILKTPAVSLVGSRALAEDNREFACEVGRQAALQGLTLVSGNAKGADCAAQEACLAAGGRVISVVADALHSQLEQENVLFVSEEDYDEAFSSQRALRRNRVIHALGWITIVAQCSLNKGGTWKGTTANLEAGWSKVLCYRDGSQASLELEQMGAQLIDIEQLSDFSLLAETQNSIFDI